MTEHQECMVCRSSRLEPLPRYRHAHLVQCGRCGFVFCRSVPAEQELVQHYGQYRRDEILSPITVQRYQELLALFEPFRKNNEILDVGCSVGYFLKQALQSGWNVQGTEYTDRAVQICAEKGISMIQGPLRAAHFGDHRFDVVTYMEVIEHLADPRSEMAEVIRLLRPGGVLYLTTPNFNSLTRLLLRERWDVIEYPEHLCYFTVSTLQRLMRSLGFNSLETRTTGISLTHLKNSLTSRRQTSVPAESDDEKIRACVEQHEGLKLAKRLANRLLSLAGVGDTIKALYQR